MMKIIIKGAREHNLRDLSLEIPRNKLVVFTGVSGSGKSSLVFDTLYAESQRQYLESVGSFVQSRIPTPAKPDFDYIEGLSTPIVVDQKRLGRNPRSTVGTVTEIYTLLRLLFSREGKPRIGDSNQFSFNNPEGACRTCKGLGEEVVLNTEKVFDWDKTLNQGAIKYSEYRVDGRRWNITRASGFFNMDKPLKHFTKQELDKLLYSKRVELSERTKGFVQTFGFEGIMTGIKRRRIDKRGSDFFEKSKASEFFDYKLCSNCEGARLNSESLGVRVNGKNIADLSRMYLTDLCKFIKSVDGPVARPIKERVEKKLDSLIELGIGYLSIDRSVITLSGGESQRVKLSRQLGSSLIEQMYILDEPSVGLHVRDIGNLVIILKKLRDSGNSVLVVEHDPKVIMSADEIVDIGPGAGRLGGNLVYQGDPDGMKNSKASLTGKHLFSNDLTHYGEPRKLNGSYEIKGVTLHNLKNVSVDIPKNVLVCITGVAGSGKSSLALDVLAKQENAVVVDQSGVGRSSRSNPATYTGIMGEIRKLFANEHGVKPGLFSFNSDGACSECRGLGSNTIEMHFLDSVEIICTKCEGKRFSDEVLGMKYKGLTITNVLDLTVNEAVKFFENDVALQRLMVLQKVGLGYLTLGQPLNTLSGGEAQRVKLSSQLHKKGELYVLDEPTTGLHMADIETLIKLLQELVENGNSVVVVEHNLDVVRNADWVIDMGPEGGEQGGKIIAEGTPLEVIRNKDSITGRFLAKRLRV